MIGVKVIDKMSDDLEKEINSEVKSKCTDNFALQFKSVILRSVVFLWSYLAALFVLLGFETDYILNYQIKSGVKCPSDKMVWLEFLLFQR